MNGTRVVMLGAGVVGAACARELSLAGFDVVVIDRGRPAGGTTSHGEGNLLVSDKAPGAELALAQLSNRLWPQVIAEIAAGDPRAAAATEFDAKGGIVVATTSAGASRLRRSPRRSRRPGSPRSRCPRPKSRPWNRR
jgi:glycine/D-amino acid oxidase-like deaminating enzyme